jgi:hypothetical protein
MPEMPPRGVRCGGLGRTLAPLQSNAASVTPELPLRSTLIRNSTDRGVLDGNPTTGSHCECPGELRLSPPTRSFEGYAG